MTSPDFTGELNRKSLGLGLKPCSGYRHRLISFFNYESRPARVRHELAGANGLNTVDIVEREGALEWADQA